MESQAQIRTIFICGYGCDCHTQMRRDLIYKLLAYCRRKGKAKGFAWIEYRDLIIITHGQLAAPLARQSNLGTTRTSSSWLAQPLYQTLRGSPSPLSQTGQSEHGSA